MGVLGLVGVVLVAVTCGVVTGSSATPQRFCPDLKPQRSLDLDQMMGMWYAVEIIQHHTAPENNAASVLLDICPVLHLTRVTTDHLRLLWDEKAGVVEYNFNIPVKNSPGFWIATGTQNGSLTADENYTHFSGTAQVMKAVGSHMVLTMCSRQEGKVFSVVMSRETSLDQTEIISVNSMLQRRNLAMGHIKETCRNAASHLGITVHQGLLALALVTITRVLSRAQL